MPQAPKTCRGRDRFHFDGCHGPTGAHDDVNLVIAFKPGEELTLAGGRCVREMCTHG
jgi:hypothetical protein